MKLVKDLTRKYSGQGMVLLVVTVLSTVLGIAIIDLGRRIINLITNFSSGSGAGSRLLLSYSALMFAAIIIAGAVGYFISVLFARMTQAVLKDIRLRLFSHLLKLPQDFYDKNSVGQIMTALVDDVAYIGQCFSQFFLLPVMNIVMIIFYTAYLFFLNWKLAVAGIITIPSTVLIMPKLNRKLTRFVEEYGRSMASISDYLMEAVSGINDIRSGQTYRFEESKFEGKIENFSVINMGLARTMGTMKFSMNMIRGIGPLLAYLYGGFLCFNGQITAGSLVASIAVIGSLYDPLDSFVNFLQEWQQARARFYKLDGYLAVKPENEVIPVEEKKPVPYGSVYFNNVRFGFSDKEVLLKDVNFKAAAGDRLAFVGTSGAGKSLTAALIARIYDPLGGKILLGNNSIDSIPLRHLRSLVGRVSQAPFLFNDTIKRNILYALLRKDAGTSPQVERWVDLSMLDGIGSAEGLDKKLINVVKDVGLFDDIYELGLRSRLGREDETGENIAKIIEARRFFLNAIGDNEKRYVERYDAEKFLEYCSLFENIVFSPAAPIIEEYGSLKEFCGKYVNKQLESGGLLEKLFNIGMCLARQDGSLLETLYHKTPRLLNKLGLNKELVEEKLKINRVTSSEKEGAVSRRRLDPLLVGEILDLVYNHVPGLSKEALLDEDTKKDIVRARMMFKRDMPGTLKDKIKFFDPGNYLSRVSIRENIIFGNADPMRKKANESFDVLIKGITEKAGLMDLVMKRGMEYTVGERGARLSGGQRQKVAIARILMKNPAILILDEATASLDAASQARITDLIRNKFNDKTVIAIAHRLSTIKDYDRILVFDKGEIVENGTFDELINLNGMFKKLYYESN